MARSKQKPAYLHSMTDTMWRNASLSERFLHVCASQVGQREDGRTNYGGMVTRFLNAAGFFRGAPWCAAFLFWALIESGANPLKLWKAVQGVKGNMAASTRGMLAWARSKNILHRGTPQRGDIGVWFNASRRGGHTFAITNTSGTGANRVLATIEGNTNDEGSREGYEVARRERTLNSLRANEDWGFIRVTDEWF